MCPSSSAASRPACRPSARSRSPRHPRTPGVWRTRRTGAGCILQVGFNRRFAEVYRIARDAVVGSTRRCSSIAQKHRPDHFYRMTLENAIHMLDLVRWFGGEVTDLPAMAAAPDPYVEDGVAVLLRYAAGGAATRDRCVRCRRMGGTADVAAGGATARVVAPDQVEISRDGETRR